MWVDLTQMAAATLQPALRRQLRRLGRLSEPQGRPDGLSEGAEHPQRGGDHGRPAHAFPVRLIRDLPDPAAGTPVLVDFVCAGVSSSSFCCWTSRPARRARRSPRRPPRPQPSSRSRCAATTPTCCSPTTTRRAMRARRSRRRPSRWSSTRSSRSMRARHSASSLLKRTRIRVECRRSTTPVIEDNV